MAALYGKMKGDRSGMVTRIANKTVWSELETWQGSILTTVESDGEFTVHIGEKGNANRLVVKGNINTREVEFNMEEEG